MNAIYHNTHENAKEWHLYQYRMYPLVSRKEKPNMRIGLSGVRKSIVEGMW